MFAVHFYVHIFTWDFLPIQLLFYWSARTKRKWNWKWKRKWKREDTHSHTHAIVCRPRVPSNINNVNNRERKMPSIPLTHPLTLILFPLPVYFIHCVICFLYAFISLSLTQCWLVRVRSETMNRNERACKQIIHFAQFNGLFYCSFSMCQHTSEVCTSLLGSNILFLFKLIRMLYIRAIIWRKNIGKQWNF